MKTELWLVTYNGMIGHPDLAVAGDLLFGQPGPSFGGAIEGFELYAHVDHHGPPLPTLDSMLARYRERLATLPRVWFRRKRRLIEVAYHSRLGAARELLDGEPKAAGGR